MDSILHLNQSSRRMEIWILLPMAEYDRSGILLPVTFAFHLFLMFGFCATSLAILLNSNLVPLPKSNRAVFRR